jgi:hypothetical protein
VVLAVTRPPGGRSPVSTAQRRSPAASYATTRVPETFSGAGPARLATVLFNEMETS